MIHVRVDPVRLLAVIHTCTCMFMGKHVNSTLAKKQFKEKKEQPNFSKLNNAHKIYIVHVQHTTYTDYMYIRTPDAQP